MAADPIDGPQPFAEVGEPLDEQVVVEVPDTLNVEDVVADDLLALQHHAQAFGARLTTADDGGRLDPARHLDHLGAQPIDETVDRFDVRLAGRSWPAAELILGERPQRAGVAGQVDRLDAEPVVE